MTQYTPSQCWDRLVGSQTTDEFMSCHDVLTVDEAVEMYLQGILDVEPEWLDGEDYDKAHRCLVRFIEQG